MLAEVGGHKRDTTLGGAAVDPIVRMAAIDDNLRTGGLQLPDQFSLGGRRRHVDGHEVTTGRPSPAEEEVGGLIAEIVEDSFKPYWFALGLQEK